MPPSETVGRMTCVGGGNGVIVALGIMTSGVTVGVTVGVGVRVGVGGMRDVAVAVFGIWLAGIVNVS